MSSAWKPPDYGLVCDNCAENERKLSDAYKTIEGFLGLSTYERKLNEQLLLAVNRLDIWVSKLMYIDPTHGEAFRDARAEFESMKKAVLDVQSLMELRQRELANQEDK